MYIYIHTLPAELAQTRPFFPGSASALIFCIYNTYYLYGYMIYIYVCIIYIYIYVIYIYDIYIYMIYIYMV